MIADQLQTEYAATPNAHVMGKLSRRSRQIDVLIDLRHDSDNSRRLIVDAKKRRRRIGVQDVEAFRGLMEDVGATHGYLVCPHGYTKAAERRAQTAVSIRLVPLDHLEEFDPASWPPCMAPSCRDGRVFWDGYPEIQTVLRPVAASANVNPSRIVSFIHYVGKCDCCGRFHVKCTTCGDVLAPTERDVDDYGQQCSCKPPWFWIASIEDDGEGTESAELHVVFASGKVITADRRSL
jgi:hypothetical protein